MFVAKYLSRFSSDVQGIIYMMMGGFFFVIMTVLARYLSHEMVDHLHAFVIVFFRSIFSFLMLIPFMVKHKIENIFTKPKWHLYIARSCNGLVVMLLWFYILSIIELPIATAMSFTTPIFTVLLAILIFDEKVGVRRWCAMIIGFIGVVIILRPGTDMFEPKTLMVLICAAGWAISNIIIKSLTKTESPQQIVFYMSLFIAPMSLPFALFFWEWPNLEQIFWLLMMSLAANFAQTCLSISYSKAEMKIVQPFDFSRLIFASVFAYYIFDEKLDIWTFLGALIIILSTIYITYRENRHKKQSSESLMSI